MEDGKGCEEEHPQRKVPSVNMCTTYVHFDVVHTAAARMVSENFSYRSMGVYHMAFVGSLPFVSGPEYCPHHDVSPRLEWTVVGEERAWRVRGPLRVGETKEGRCASPCPRRPTVRCIKRQTRPPLTHTCLFFLRSTRPFLPPRSDRDTAVRAARMKLREIIVIVNTSPTTKPHQI